MLSKIIAHNSTTTELGSLSKILSKKHAYGKLSVIINTAKGTFCIRKQVFDTTYYFTPLLLNPDTLEETKVGTRKFTIENNDFIAGLGGNYDFEIKSSYQNIGIGSLLFYLALKTGISHGVKNYTIFFPKTRLIEQFGFGDIINDIKIKPKIGPYISATNINLENIKKVIQEKSISKNFSFIEFH